LLQEPAEGIVFAIDVHVPANEPGAGGAAGADGTLGSGFVFGVGARMLVLLSTRAHAVTNGKAAATIASSTGALFMDYNLVRVRTELCVQHPAIHGNRRI